MTPPHAPGTDTSRPDAVPGTRAPARDSRAGNDSTAASETADGAIDDTVDAASGMSFPASDPPAWMGSVACAAPCDR